MSDTVAKVETGRAMTAPDWPYPKPTAQIKLYFEVLGLDDTLRFIEQFGGTEIYISEPPRPGNCLDRQQTWQRAGDIQEPAKPDDLPLSQRPLFPDL